MIKSVIRTSNDMVMVFDENGDEMPEYQGFYYDVKDRIVADAQVASVFHHWFGNALLPEAVDLRCW